MVVVPKPSQFISQRFGITCTSLSLLLQSISPLLRSLCMYITRITLCHVLLNLSSFSCSYSLLHLSSLGPPAPTPSSEFGPPAPTPSSDFGPPAQTPSSEFGPPAPTPSSEFGPPAPTPSLEPRLQGPSSLEPQLRLPKNPRSVSPFSTFCILPRIEYSSLQFHFDIQQNNISSNVIIMY